MSTIDLALVGARIRTLDPEKPTAAAVAVADGEIVAVGSDAEIRELGAAAETVDLHGAVVVPGLTDSHIHPLQGALDTRGADLRDLSSLEDVRAALAAERKRCSPDQWVLGFGLEYDVFRESGIRGELFDDVVEGSPALLTFMDLHTAVATPRALELAGVTGPQSFSENAEIVCQEGTPTGELREWAAVAVVERALPKPSDAERYALHVVALREQARAGLTGGHAMDGTLATHDLLRELEANGDLVQRFVVPFTIVPESQPDDWAELLPAPGRSRSSLAGRSREVLHRRRDRCGDGLAVRARHGGRGDTAVLAGPAALPPGGRDVRSCRFPVRDARDR